MKTFLTLFIAVLGFSAPPFQLKNFGVGGEGNWETTTSIAEGPQKGQSFKTSTCFKGTPTQEMTEKSNAELAADCTFQILKDTKEIAEFKHTCKKSVTHTTMKRVDSKTFEIFVDTLTDGKTMKIKTVGKYVGPCDTKASKSGPACDQCEANVKMIESTCQNLGGKSKEGCLKALPKLKENCKAQCRK